MPTIQVDFDVFKAITARRPSEDVTENDVLRQLFGLPSANGNPGTLKPQHQPGDWVSKGVRFPQGTQARARYKGQLHLAEVRNGGLVMNGKRYDSPSSAAMAVTNNTPVNGWTFWEVMLPGQSEWKRMKELRPEE